MVSVLWEMEEIGTWSFPRGPLGGATEPGLEDEYLPALELASWVRILCAPASQPATCLEQIILTCEPQSPCL